MTRSWPGRPITGATARTRCGTTAPTCTSSSSDGDEASFASYIFVTHIVGGVAPLSTAIVHGTVRLVGDRLRIAALEVVLDTSESELFSECRELDAVPPTEKARATRAALVRSAAALFVEQGYGAVSIRDLARRTTSPGAPSTATSATRPTSSPPPSPNTSPRISTCRPMGSQGFATTCSGSGAGTAPAAGLRALLVEGAAAARVDPDIRRQLHELQSSKLGEWKVIYRGDPAEGGPGSHGRHGCRVDHAVGDGAGSRDARGVGHRAPAAGLGGDSSTACSDRSKCRTLTEDRVRGGGHRRGRAARTRSR